MNESKAPTAIILLAYGGPDSLEDIPAYLLDIRDGRHTPQPLIDEITRRYRLIGGRSPLLEITRSVAEKLQRRIDLPVYVAMRHWRPFIKDVVAQTAASGVQRLVGICMAPHYSELSIGKYRQQLVEAVDKADHSMTLTFVENWHTQLDFLEAVAANIRETLTRWPKSEQDGVTLVFTAHSLPEFILERGDPYDQQLRETASLLAGLLAIPEERWTFSYQSAAQTGVPWLGPQIEAYLVELAARGRRNLLIAPIGFIADHVEILYDIDIGLENIAREHGVRIERTPMLNDSDGLVSALASLVQAQQISMGHLL